MKRKIANSPISSRGKAALLEDLMDVPTAAKRLGGVSIWAVKNWINQGRIRKTKVGARTMVSAGALQDFLEECASRG